MRRVRPCFGADGLPSFALCCGVHDGLKYAPGRQATVSGTPMTRAIHFCEAANQRREVAVTGWQVGPWRKRVKPLHELQRPHHNLRRESCDLSNDDRDVIQRELIADAAADDPVLSSALCRKRVRQNGDPAFLAVVDAPDEQDSVAVMSGVRLGNRDLFLGEVKRHVVGSRGLHLEHQRPPTLAEHLDVKPEIIISDIAVIDYVAAIVRAPEAATSSPMKPISSVWSLVGRFGTRTLVPTIGVPVVEPLPPPTFLDLTKQDGPIRRAEQRD